MVARRQALVAALASVGPPVTLCPQTPDLVEAQDWMENYLQAGLEVLVIKRADQPYVAGRIWWKYRARWPVDLVILGVTGATAALLLGAVDPGRGLVTVGASVRLRKAASREVGRAMVPVGRARPRRLATFSGFGDPVLVQPVVPVVAEFLVDVAIERGRLRHPARFRRLRLELDPDSVVIACLQPRSGGNILIAKR